MKKKVISLLLVALCLAVAVTAAACNKGAIASVALMEGTQFEPVVEGGSPDFSDKMLVVTYSDKTTREVEITPDMLSDFDNTKLGEQSATITYIEVEDSASTEITLTVIARAIATLEVTAEPTTKDYIAGEKFRTAGMEVTAVYNDGSRVAVDDYTVSPLVLSADVSEVTVGYSGKSATLNVSVTEPDVTATTSAELTAALAGAEDGDAIAVEGTIGSNSREDGYTIYNVKSGVKIVGTGDTMPTIYGSFFVDSDDVLIRGLRIKNRGWVSEDEHTAHRNAITAVTNKITVEHVETVAPTDEEVDTTTAISNGIIIYAPTDEGSAVTLRHNSFIGFGNDNEEWSSVAVDIVAGADFPFNATNANGAAKSARVSLNEGEIISTSRFSGYSDNYIYSDYTDGGYNVYLRAYVTDVTGLENALTYAHPDGITITLAAGTYTLTEAMSVDNVTMIGLGADPVIISGELTLGENTSTQNVTLTH